LNDIPIISLSSINERWEVIQGLTVYPDKFL